MSKERAIIEEPQKSQEYWLMLLFSLVTDTPKIDWDEFEHGLKYVNRFSSSHEVVDTIKNNADKSKRIIKQGQDLFRARVYKEDPLIQFLADIYVPAKKKKDERCVPVSTVNNISKYTGMMMAATLLTTEEGTEKRRTTLEKYKKWQRKRYKGFSAADSGMPPADLAPAGRINPENISYLYLAEDPLTCVYEVRPTIGQHVSIATFRLTKDIVVYDLASNSEGKDNLHNPLLFNYIEKRFSTPNAGDTLHYLPTQFLSEVIKEMGFDGIRYRSSLKQEGVNVVLFSDQNCKVINSEVVDVMGINLDVVPSELYQMESMLKQNQ